MRRMQFFLQGAVHQLPHRRIGCNKRHKEADILPIRIFIDQGHNPQGVNAGAEGFGLREQDVNYEVGMELARLLNGDPRFTARVSRTTPTEVLGTSNATSLQRRVQLANAWPANYFVSIHCNANTNPAIHGTEVYVYRQNTQAYWLAQHVLTGIVDAVGTRDNGVRLNPSLYVLRRTTMPAILVELAYLTNGGDALKLRDQQPAFAQGIYDGLLAYFGFQPL